MIEISIHPITAAVFFLTISILLVDVLAKTREKRESGGHRDRDYEKRHDFCRPRKEWVPSAGEPTEIDQERKRTWKGANLPRQRRAKKGKYEENIFEELNKRWSRTLVENGQIESQGISQIDRKYSFRRSTIRPKQD